MASAQASYEKIEYALFAYRPSLVPGTIHTPAYRAIVAALRDARLAAGLHQAELAARVGKEQSFISNIERSERRIDLLEFYAIAQAMGRDPAELFTHVTMGLPDRVTL